MIPADDFITQVSLHSGEDAVNYDFCEQPLSRLSGYVFQDGVPITLLPGQTADQLYLQRDGKRTADDTPIPGVRMLLGDQFGNPVYDSNGVVRIAITNAQGYYEFNNLVPGFYTMHELQPAEYIDNIDTAGSTSGFAFNPNGTVPLFVLSELAVTPGNDFIADQRARWDRID